MVEMMLDATREYEQPLASERLFPWHASLFPAGRSGMLKITSGAWRDDSEGPMQVVSGPMGKDHLHFEVPKPDCLVHSNPNKTHRRRDPGSLILPVCKYFYALQSRMFTLIWGPPPDPVLANGPL